jgi:hypothetical protein
MLSEEAKELIRLEESYRHEIRAGLDAKGRLDGWLKFLNSGFGLWMLTTIAAGLGATLWANWQERFAAQDRWWAQKNAAFRRLWDLDRELDFRLKGYRNILDRTREEIDPLVKKEKSGTRLDGHPTLEETRQLLSGAYKELDAPQRPAYPANRDLSLYALVAQAELASLERYDSRLPNYNTAKAMIFSLRDLNDRLQGLSLFSEIKVTVDMIDALLKKPGLGEWYYHAGLNESPGFYKSEGVYRSIDLLEARGDLVPSSPPWKWVIAGLGSLCTISWLVLRRYRVKVSTSNTQTSS